MSAGAGIRGDHYDGQHLSAAPRASGWGVVERSLLTTLGAGLLGLAVDASANLYAAVASFNPATHGVWRITRDGSGARLAGSQAMFFPNALAFDERGNLYVTSSSGPPAGAGIWLDGQISHIPPVARRHCGFSTTC
jgi:hypothetical protein